MPEFDRNFEMLTGHAPFPWQRRLFERFSAGALPVAVDIPTGLGKTAAMAIWLLAWAAGAPLPRRLVYVVDRRAVVDQATDFAETLRKRLNHPDLDPVRSALRLAGRSLPISTLRGQHVDNREWLDDPAAPAIVVGTVDMIGSRLLFEGYGVSRRMRPYQAGLMGCDTLVLLDEAHLSQPFGRLLRTIETQRRARATDDADAVLGKFAGPRATPGVPPPFRVLPLSATLASESESAVPAIMLDGEDRRDETVRARLDASKTLTVEDLDKRASMDDVLAERAWSLTRQEAEARGRPVRVLIYCDKRKTAESVAADLRRREKAAKNGAAVILFVGGRRVHERETAHEKLRLHGLLGGGDGAATAPVFVIATSAGEVGVDLDADHMVCDLVSWERMVQRLGRVNRRGSGAARVLVIDQGPTENAEDVARHLAVRALLSDLPTAGNGRQAGPGALEDLCRSPEGRNRVEEASTPMPLYPALNRPLVDAWSMTSLVEHSGRPEVEPWLRGWVDQDPQTTIVWRRYLPVRVEAATSGAAAVVRGLAEKAVAEFFEAASPHTAERLEAETSRVVEWLRKRARKLMRTLAGAPRRHEPNPDLGGGSQAREVDAGDEPQDILGVDQVAPLRGGAPLAFVLDSAGGPDGNDRSDCVLALGQVAGVTAKELERRLAGRTLVVDARIGGLTAGLLDATNGNPAPTAEDNWGAPYAWDRVVGDDVATAGLPAVRVRLLTDDGRDRLTSGRAAAREGETQEADAWCESWAEPYRVSAADLPLTWLVVEKWRAADPDEDARAIRLALQDLEAHQEQAALEADRIAADLGLPSDYRRMLVAAARHHDDGKRARRWQRAFSAPRKGGPYAKTPGPLNRHLLGGYRHEFQSMLDAEENGLEGLDLSDERFELALHLIAAHHGRARPAIGIDGVDGLPPTAASRRARSVGLRFARLQREWGPWGLAWWEALLRAADQRASRALDEAARRARKTGRARTSHAASGAGQLGLFGPAGEGAD